MKTRDDILRDNPLIPYLESSGVKIKGSGRQRMSNRCAIAQHKPDHWCVSIDAQNQVWFCNDCSVGGSVIDWIMHATSQTASDVLKTLGGEPEPVRTTPTPSKSNGGTTAAQIQPRPKIVATYDYTDESLQLVYQAVRLEPKSFRQRVPDGKGGWIWSMDGITRLLFNLPAVLAATSCAIAEGEKDCQTLNSIGYTATCNVGGAGKWLPAYSERLKGKDIIVFPDNDTAGRKHATEIITSLDGKANSIKQVIIPEPFKDVTEFFESFPDKEQAKREIALLVDKTGHLVKPLPIYSVQEMEVQYREHTQRILTESFDLGKFLPEFRMHVKPMVPGEVLLLLADTGTGKTAVLQQLLRSAFPLASLLFELELPISLLFERFVQMEVGCFSTDVQNEYREQNVPLWKKYRNLQHISVCPESGLSTEQIESYIVRSELKIGRRPVVVAVDYVGLLNNRGTKSRYEAVSKCAEEMKVIAKRTNTIVLMASQIARPDKKESLEIGLHDAKDSGSLECSAGIVIGAWRPEKSRLMFKILKNTSGTSGAIIDAKFDGSKMQITSEEKEPTNWKQ